MNVGELIEKELKNNESEMEVKFFTLIHLDA